MKYLVLLATYFAMYTALIVLTDAELWSVEWWLIYLGSFAAGIVARAFYSVLEKQKERTKR